jgi:hypothetical protein
VCERRGLRGSYTGGSALRERRDLRCHRHAIADPGGIMKRRVVCTLVTTLAIGLGGCGGGGSSPSSSTPSLPSPITKGLLLISQTGNGLYGMTPAGLWRLKLPIEVRAMNDIPLTLNHARLTLYNSTGAEIFRVEVGASDIISQAATNLVTRDRTLAFTIVFQYSPQAEVGASTFTMLLSATDANGNSVEASLLTNSRWVADPELQ